MGLDDLVSKPVPAQNFGAEFRQKLRGLEAISALKELNNERCVEEFLSEGGDISQVVSVLHNVDPSDIHVVLDALALIIKRYLTVASAEDTAHCEEVCHTLLTVHASTIQKCFSHHKATVFRLFSSMTQVSFHIAKTILLSFEKCLLIDKKDNSVRKDYIDLVNTLLSDEHLFITRTLLEKKILNKVISGILYDKYASIVTILSTITEKIISSSINKSLKMQVFNTSSLAMLYKLYQWKGTPQQYNEVRRTVHTLLLHLCTDYKKGIVYFDESYGTSRESLNPLIFNFLRKIETPWTDDLSSDLVIKTLHACPDLVKPMFDVYKSSFLPRDSDIFYKICDFLKDFTSKFNIVNSLTNSSLLVNIMKYKLFPSSVLELIKAGTDLKTSIPVRNACHDLYLVVLNKLTEVFSQIKKKFPENYESIVELMQADLPELPELLKCWQVGEDNAVDHLLKLAEVILAYCNVFPLNCIPDRTTSFFDDIDSGKHKLLYVNALQINAILFEPSINDDTFQRGLMFILLEPIDDFDHVFHTLLNACHLFDGFEQELEIWYQALCDVDIASRQFVVDAFIAGLTNMNEMLGCLELADQVKSAANDFTSEVNEFTPVPNMTPCLPALLEHCNSQEEIKYFISQVTLSLLHIQVCSKSFYAIIKTFLKLPKSETSIMSYLKAWGKEGRATYMPDIGGDGSSLKMETQLSHVLVDRDETRLTTFVGKLSAKKNKTKRLLNCARIALFYATQSTDNEVIGISADAFIKLSTKLPEPEQKIIVQEAFMNPMLSKDFAEDAVLLLNVLTHLVEISPQHSHIASYRNLVFPKLKKLLSEGGEKKSNSSGLLSLISRLGLGQREAKDILTLMLQEDTSKFYKKKKTLSFWGKLLQYVLGEIKCELSEESYVKLEGHLVEMIQAGVEVASLEEALVKYIHYHPYCVQYMNIDNLLDKISSQLTVTLISINPDIVSHLPKPRELSYGLSIVKAILKYSPLLGDKYMSRVYKLIEKNLTELILSDMVAYMSDYLTELDHVLDKNGPSESVQKIHEHIISRPNLVITANNCPLLTLLSVKFRDPDALFTKLVTTFVQLPQEERAGAKWIHEGLVKTVTENSALSFAPSSSWHDFVRACLKDGLSGESSLCLDTLTTLCRILPGDKCHHNIFKMIISHSKFVEIMLCDSAMKDSLVIILNVFIKGGHVPLAPSHVPLYLSAYNATLSHTDQHLFDILQHYEAKDVDLHAYKPFLWGSAAATYYSVSDTIMTKSLNRQPHPSQVTSLLLDLRVKGTITDFPLDRKLVPTELSENDPKKYDPSFLLPLFIFLLAPESPVQLHKFINSGALALSLAGLASNDPAIRKSAYMALFRFQTHLSSLKQEQSGLLAHFIDVLRNGITQLIDDKEEVNPQLSAIVSIFLARASLIITNPSHQLYSALHMYFIAKPALDLTKVPEFLVLFHSDNEYNRKWILSIVRDGLINHQDWMLCDRTVIFKILFTYHTSRLCTKEVQTLIADIINKCLAIEKGRFYLINSQGLLSWLIDVPHPVSLLQTLTKHQKSDQNGFLQILLLHSLFSSKSPESSLPVLNCILEFLQSGSKHDALLFDHLDSILEFVKTQFGADMVRESENLRQHSCRYVLPFDDMMVMTKITYLLLTNQRK